MHPDLESGNLAEAGSERRLPAPRGGLLARHWRGDYSLARSYWLNGVLLFGFGQLPFLVALAIAVTLLQGRGALVLVVGLGGVALQVAAYVWAVVGVWRAAGKYKGPRVWPILARIAIGLGVLVSIANVSMTMGAIAHAMSSQDDIYVPGHAGQAQPRFDAGQR